MNKNNCLEYIPFITALSKGKTIQVLSYGEWIDLDNNKDICFDQKSSFYRIKTEPRIFEMWLDRDTGCMSTTEVVLLSNYLSFDRLERIVLKELIL